MDWESPGKNALLMSRIDAHQHFWNYDPVRDNWITEEMSIIRKDFLPQELESILKSNGFAGSVVVQSDQSEDENRFQLINTEKFDFIKGIVGWVDFQNKDVDDSLAYYSSFKKMKGFRHVLQGEARRDIMLCSEFMSGISKMEKYGFTYDILIHHDQLQYIPSFVSAFPQQKFVIDHIAKPNIKDKEIGKWKKEIEAVAKYENVYCKISGMVTEAEWSNWKPEDFKPYLDAVVKAFGIKRIMFGSDWPVCLVAADYEKVLSISEEYFSSFSMEEQELFFGKNAMEFYNL